MRISRDGPRGTRTSDGSTAGPVHLPGARARFTTSNVDEALPGVLAPLTWSFYFPPVDEGAREAWHGFGAMAARELEVSGDVDQRFFTPVLGHAATNVDLFGRMADRMPGGSAASMEEQLFGTTDRASTPERFRWRRYPIIAAKAPWALRRAMRDLEPLAAEIEVWWARTTGVSTGPETDGAALLVRAREMLRRVLSTHFVLTMACQGVMERVQKLAERAGMPGLERELVRSDAGTAEFELVSDLRALAAGDIDLARFLAAHGYHGPHEGQLDAVVWREDPTPVTNLIDAYRQRGGQSTGQMCNRLFT